MFCFVVYIKLPGFRDENEVGVEKFGSGEDNEKRLRMTKLNTQRLVLKTRD